MPESGKWRRRLKRLALGAAIGVALLALAFFCLPLPIGWAINLAATRALPPELGLCAQVAAGTFRWRIGHDAARLEISGLSASVKDRPLAAVRSIVVEIDKRAAWRGSYAPRVVAIMAPHVVVDTSSDGAFARLQAATASAGPKPATAPPPLLSLAPFFPAPERDAALHVDDLRIDYVFPGIQWSLVGKIDTTLTRRGDEVRVATTADLGTRDHPIKGTTTVDVSLRTGKIAFSVSLPEFRTADLPPLPGGKLPVEGALSLTVAGEADYATRTVSRGELEFSFHDGQIALPGMPGPPIAIERLVLRGKAAPQPDGLHAELERGELVVDGATVDVRKLEAVVAAQSRVTWDAVVANVSGARLAAHVSEAVRSLVPWLPLTLREASVSQFHSKGSATLARNRDGTLQLHDFESEQDFAGQLADATLAVAVNARQQPAGPIAVSFRLRPFQPTDAARAFPREWLVGAAAFPVALDADARVSAAGELVDADARLEIGAGELRAITPVPLAVPIRRISAWTRVSQNAARIEIPTVVADTALGRFEIGNVVVQRAALSANLSGRLGASGIEAGAFEKGVPAEALARLREAGLALGDLALREAAIDFTAALKAPTGASWEPASVDLHGEVELGFAGKPIALRVEASLPTGATEATARVKINDLSPAAFGARKVAGVSLADFQFPIGLEATARLGARDGRVASVGLRADVGAGQARIATLDTVVPFHGAQLEVEFDPQKNIARIASAQLQLAPGLEGGVRNVTVALQPLTRISGTATLAPLALRDAMAWWPAKLLPETRAQVLPLIIGGKLQCDGIEFELAAADAKSPPAPTKARGTITLSGFTGKAPAVPGLIEVEAARIIVDYPRAALELQQGRARGVVVEAARANVADVMAARPFATAEATVFIDAAAAKEWTTDAPAISGSIRAQVSGSARIDPTDFSGAKLAATLTGERLSLPGVFEGPLSVDVDVSAPTKTTLAVTGKVSIADAKLLSLERRPSVGPLSLSLTLRDWSGIPAPWADLTLSAEDFAGLPLRVNATADFSKQWQSVMRAELREFVLGRTNLRGAWQRPEPDHESLSLSGPRIDVAELAGVAAPWLGLLRPPAAAPEARAIAASSSATVAKSVAATAALPPASASSPNPSRSVTQWETSLDVAEIVFGQAQRLRGVKAEAKIENDWPSVARFAATEGERNAVSLELTPVGEKQRLKIGVADLAALARTVTEPLRTTRLPPGNLAATAETCGRIPLLIAGGALGIDGELTPHPTRAGFPGAKGNILLTDATMIRAPRVLQLLALRSGKKLEQSPLIRRLSVGEWALDADHVTVKTFALEGSGLIDRVKLNSVGYTFATDKLAIDGEYFGVGFEVVGTRADPQVFLKENKLIRAIGQRNEFDVFFEDDPAKSPPKKK